MNMAGKKLHHFTMRVSAEWLDNIRAICKRKSRTVTAQLERSVEIARIVEEFCDGNDDLEFIRRRLGESKCLSKYADFPDGKSEGLIQKEIVANRFKVVRPQQSRLQE
jgi:hypothetical protein